jgi:hypothetical protein
MFAALIIEFSRFFLVCWQIAAASFELPFLGTAIICSFTVKCESAPHSFSLAAQLLFLFCIFVWRTSSKSAGRNLNFEVFVLVIELNRHAI